MSYNDNFKGDRNMLHVVSSKIIISNLYYGVTESDLEDLFTDCGTIKKLCIHYDSNGKSRGTGNVTFYRKCDAIKAFKKYNRVQLDGRAMNIKIVNYNRVPNREKRKNYSRESFQKIVVCNEVQNKNKLSTSSEAQQNNTNSKRRSIHELDSDLETHVNRKRIRRSDNERPINDKMVCTKMFNKRVPKRLNAYPRTNNVKQTSNGRKRKQKGMTEEELDAQLEPYIDFGNKRKCSSENDGTEMLNLNENDAQMQKIISAMAQLRLS